MSKIELPIKITLQNPVTIAGEEITEIVFVKQPTGADFQGLPINNPSMGDLARIAAKIAKVPPSTINSLSPTDYTEVISRVSDFL